MSAEKTIALNGNFRRDDKRVAAVALTPGELVEIDSAGKYAPHGTAKGFAQRAFVLENELAGEGIEIDIAVANQVPVNIFSADALVLAFLAISQTIAVGDKLESAGNGNLRALTVFAQSGTTPFAVTAEGHAIAVAEEAVTTTSVRKRIRVSLI